MPGNPSIGNPAPYAVEAILEGLNATQGLNAVRAAGGGISTQSWYRAYGEATAALGNLRDVAGLDLFDVPGRDQFVQWTAGKEPGFVYQFQIEVQDPDTGLSMLIPHTVISPEIITIGEAVGQVISDLAGIDSNTYGIGSFIAPASVDLLAMTPAAA